MNTVLEKKEIDVIYRNDIGPSWEHLFRIINQVVPITQFASSGGWNGRGLDIAFHSHAHTHTQKTN